MDFRIRPRASLFFFWCGGIDAELLATRLETIRGDYQGTRMRHAARMQRAAFSSSSAARKFHRHDNSRINGGGFVREPARIFQNWNRFRLTTLMLTSADRPAIKVGINFFLDFDFQPLYTFINCGFSFETADP
jgi:hypothetical protein